MSAVADQHRALYHPSLLRRSTEPRVLYAEYPSEMFLPGITLVRLV